MNSSSRSDPSRSGRLVGAGFAAAAAGLCLVNPWAGFSAATVAAIALLLGGRRGGGGPPKGPGPGAGSGPGPGTGSEAEARLAALEARLREATAIMRRAARGDLEARIFPAPAGEPERGFAHALNDVLDITDAFVREAQASLQHVAGGQHFRRILRGGLLGTFRTGADTINGATERMGRRVAHFSELTQDFEHQVMQVSRAVAEAAGGLDAAAGTLGAAMGAAAEGMDAVGRNAAGSAEGAREAAAASDGLSRSIATVGADAAATRDASRGALEKAAGSAAAIAALTHAVGEIDGVLSVIDDIARQTDLLSLNAMVEAARAGRAGAGFGVVAQEVKQLAERTALATADITGRIGQVRDLSAEVARAVGAMRETIAQASERAAATDAAVADQARAVVAIAGTMGTLAERASEARATLEENGARVAAASDALGEMRAAVGRLTERAAQLDRELGHYLGAARAA